MLYAMGGAVDVCDDKLVLKTLLNAAKGVDSVLRVVTSATGYPEEARQSYGGVFQALGVQDCLILHPSDHCQANDPAMVAQINQADIIFFTGGDQLRLTRALGGTRFMDAVNKRFQDGCIIAGTSAGSAAMSADMIYAEDPPEDSDDQRPIITLKDGFALSKEFVIDTHFSERGRLGRLFEIVSKSPARRGLGIDEDTAAIIRPDNTIEITGAGTATLVDGAGQTVLALRAGEIYDFANHAMLRPKAP